jgi:hypothetical protein
MLQGADETTKGSLMGKMIFSAMLDVARSHRLWGGALAPPVVAASMCKVARKALNTRPEDGEEGHPGMAEAVCVICLLEGGPNAAGWASWALSKIKNMPASVFRGLVYVAMQGSPDLMHRWSRPSPLLIGMCWRILLRSSTCCAHHRRASYSSLIAPGAQSCR